MDESGEEIDLSTLNEDYYEDDRKRGEKITEKDVGETVETSDLADNAVIGDAEFLESYESENDYGYDE